ncbi:hypothetical protein [Idiomarina sp.]
MILGAFQTTGYLLNECAFNLIGGIKAMVERVFNDIPEGKVTDADEQSFLVGLGWSRGSSWDDLLQSKRILIVSEAGAGKTYECREQSKRLWAAGQPAFFVELAELAKEDLVSLLDEDEETRLGAWLASQYEIATFFLDSVDELKLTMGSFERALKRLKKSIGGQLHRARIVITSRPIPFDEKLVKSLLPVPPIPSSESDEETFAKVAMREHREKHNNSNKNNSRDWRSVGLMPLSDEQIVNFCRREGVSAPDLFFEDLQRRNALEFARRPQDLIELCADWSMHKRIRTHRDQVDTNVRVKLLPREPRAEAAELSIDKAIEGASRIALAVQMTRRLTIRHSAESDVIDEDAALDPSIILSDWKPNERKALLERPLFGFASYGRVRFHHRSVAEYLAAERLMTLREHGMPFKALKRLIFAETQNKIIVRPSKRPVAGWLALQDSGIFELLRDHEPAVLLNEGDPESLMQTQRNQALCAFAKRYGPGGWRGLQVPHIQVHRFASNELADEVERIWRCGVENPDVREVLISLIEAGRIEACADIVSDITQEISATAVERIIAIQALVALEDKRLESISAGIADGDELWHEKVACGAILHLFPKHMSVDQLCRALRWIKQGKRDVSDFNWQLSSLIARLSLELPELEELRDGLLAIVSEGITWLEGCSHIASDWAHLNEALAATCKCGLDKSQDDQWLHASVVASRLHHRDHYNDEPIKSLHQSLINLKAEDNERLFWIDDALLQSLHEIKEPWVRLAEITIHGGPVELRPDRDLTWVCEALSDTSRDIEERAMLLEAAIRLPPDRETSNRHVERLRPLIVDEPSLVERLEDWLKPSKFEKQQLRWEKKRAEQKKQDERRKAKNRASWIQFWRDVANHPEKAFSKDESWNTAWNLWRAMSHDGADSRASGWNRRFIEEQFNQETADKLRRVLMKIWRDDYPTFPSERPEGSRNTFLVRWQLGLAAIYAEAESPNWAAKLNDAEAELAARYAPFELNGLPEWLEELTNRHPKAVNKTLGNELSWQLDRPPGEQGPLSLLQVIEYAPEKVACLFLPRLESWLGDNGEDIIGADDASGISARVRQATRIIIKHGDAARIKRLQMLALQRLEKKLPFPIRLVWLSTLMQIEPQEGVERLIAEVEVVEPSKQSEAVTWLAKLFGNDQDGISLRNERFTPQLLLKLLRLAYRHVRIQDDANHQGPYSPDIRDNAEQARNSIVTALLDARGDEGLAAKLEMAEYPLCAHFKDRILAVAAENWAIEIDADTFDEAQAAALDRTGEAPTSTNEAMFALLKDRLSEFDELLLRDDSPREAWALISDEKVMRREIARELKRAANSLYTVDQEAVTADEKETDIRLRSVLSKHEAVIELKLGNADRSAKELLDTIERQLVKKYMADEHCRAGALLITLARDRKWQHPEEKHKINADELLSLLIAEADRVQQALGNGTYIYVHLLDLRPRLTTESNAK